MNINELEQFERLAVQVERFRGELCLLSERSLMLDVQSLIPLIDQ
jgi:hypothetical protein